MVLGPRAIVVSFELHQNRSCGFRAVGGRDLPCPVALHGQWIYDDSLHYRTSRDGDRYIQWVIGTSLMASDSDNVTKSLWKGRKWKRLLFY